MEWMRDWIMQIAGIVVIGAVCDTIMTDGNMKKYVKMVVGLILVFVIIKPLVNTSPDMISVDFPENTQQRAVELKNHLDEYEMEQVIGIYESKLEKSVEDHVYTKWDLLIDAEVFVEEEDDKNFGRIKKLNIHPKSETNIPNNELKKYVGEKFDVSFENIDIE